MAGFHVLIHSPSILQVPQNSFSMFPLNMDDPQYIIIVDAGSTKSQIHVFQYDDTDRRGVQRISTQKASMNVPNCEGGMLQPFS